MNISSLEPLLSFRQHMYHLFTRRRDALFDLTDALLSTGPTLSPAHLSLAPSFQRRWCSVYDALVDGQIDGQAVERLLAQHPLEAGEPIYAVDASVWARCDARFESPTRLLSSSLPSFGWTTDCGRVGLPLDCPGELRP